jgi:hypothetical protein
MRVVLEIQPGSVAPRSVTIEAGSEVRVGRMAPARVVLDDQTVSRQHFAIAFDGRTCRIRDLGSTHGTLVNGEPVTAAVLHDGDLIQAGMTTLRVRFAEEGVEESSLPVVPGPSDRPDPADGSTRTLEMPALGSTLHDLVIQELRARKEPLYAILDAARDPLILTRLLECKEEHQSLYEGAEGDKLAAYAPYLVALPSGSAFLETIVRDGWGKSWGVFLTCEQPFRDLRKHLRHFLMVHLEGGQQVYFRFYDPRVLRIFLPTCTPTELAQFFGAIGGYLMEGPEPGAFLRFEVDGLRLQQSTTRLDERSGLVLAS